jgi:tetratricopeptide (TPR) repeat protein
MLKKNILTKSKKAKAEQFAFANRLVEAETLFAGVCKADPVDVEAWVKLGVIQCRLGRYFDAESCARRALLLEPSLTFAQQTLATILQCQGKTDEASVILENALARHPTSSERMVNLANLREKQGQVHAAFELYHNALDLQPDTAYVLAKQGELLEKEGRLVEAEEIIARGLAREPGDPDLNLMAARLDRRAGRHSEAADRLEAVLHFPMSADTSMEIHILLGQLHDLLGNTRKVLPRLLEGKRRIALAIDPDGGSRTRFLTKVDTIRSFLSDRLAAAAPAPTASPADTPIFLIGFLRSGTTLLEQVLDSHPRLQTLSEKPMAEVMEHAFLAMTGGGPEALTDLSAEQIANLRQVYWREVARHCDRQANTVLVDKQPLNIVQVPLLWRVFPEARFILTIRHPCDVVLGCLMQKFGDNNVMSGFADLESIAELYCRVMSAWLDYEQRLPLHWQRIRYEDLVTNFEAETRALLEFLGVGWSETVLEHTQHAQQRGIINTPSYHQVIQPLYQHAKYRWRRYESELAQVVEMLRPLIDRFGYAESLDVQATVDA